MKQKSKLSGEQAFHQFYQQRFGQRWPALQQALLSQHGYTQLDEGLHSPYHLDTASILAAEALDVQPGMDVLDMCAAPGGKALVLALALQGKGSLTANEFSRDRFFRLRRNLQLLKNPPDKGIFCTQSDARRYGMDHRHVHFDCILLDAPCSSEAYVLKNPHYLQQWGPRRAKRLAIEQLAMLCQAVQLCKEGGKILYSTCSLNEDENDAVIERLMKKRAGHFSIYPLHLSLGQRTQYGWQIWPDIHHQGPMYIACLQKEKSPEGLEKN